MALLQKPTNIYHTDEQNTGNPKDSWMNEFENMFKTELGDKVVEETLKQDKIQEFTEPEKVVEPTIDELSYEQKMEFVKKFAKEFNLEFSMKVTPAIEEPPTPSVTPTIEVQPEPIVEEVKIETPKETEKPITFNFEKPEGWNKKRKRINFFKVLFNGVFGVDMDPADFRRYEKFIDNIKPFFIILLIVGFIASGFYFKVADNKNYNKKITIIDRVFNYCADKYDDWTGRNKNFKNIEKPSVDTPINLNYVPKFPDTTIKINNMDDWEKQYQQLDSNTKK